jgi:uncharacterized protein (DUF1800 family)
MPLLKDLAPIEPGKDIPWDHHTAAHLLRRAGFGASKAEISRAVDQGLAATIDALFAEAPEQEAEFQETFSRISGQLADFTDLGQMQTWWVYRLLRTKTPLREKLTLFWHGHFATSNSKVEDTALMLQQCETLRKLAWGNFRELLHAVSRDPALIAFLDGDTNTRENPNENFGRELLEQFTLGYGQFKEADVRAASRAFTGWGREGGKYVFNAENHDGDAKEFLGHKGNFDGGDILEILAKHPTTAQRIARKLLIVFACPTPDSSVVAAASQSLLQVEFNIKAFLQRLFQSKYFYSAVCNRARIASPTEYVIGACRSLGARLTAQELRQNLVDMGQELFAPPNVRGWDGEQKWINSATWAARMAFAQRLSELPNESNFGPRLDLTPIVPVDLADPAKIVDMLVDLLLDGSLAPEKRNELVIYLTSTDEGDKKEQFAQEADFRRQQTKALLGVMLSLPEYHAY